MIITQPANQLVTVGQTATFNVVATGSAPLLYQWRKNGVNISGATASSYTTPATTLADHSASFSVVVSNSVNSATSNNAILSINSPPSITSPATAMPNPALIGQSVAFTITASDNDSDALTYAWAFGDGTVGMGNSVAHTYVAAGIYFAVVTINDGRGGTTISSIQMVVNGSIAPIIIISPANMLCTVGQTATFSVYATGTAPLTYQWRKNGASIPGATSDSYTTPATTPFVLS